MGNLLQHGFTSYHLKLLAMVTMVIDHIGAVLVPSLTPGNELAALYWILRGIGRVSFPLYAFLLAEGVIHTRDIRRYICRMAVWAALSEIPFDLAFYRDWYYPAKQNVMMTFTFCLLMLSVMQQIQKEADPCRRLVGYLAAVGAASFLTVWWRTDYAATGPIMTAAFWLIMQEAAQNRALRYSCAALLSAACSIGLYGAGMFAAVPIGLYNGKRGKRMGMIAYAFYPVHLAALALIAWGIRRYIG